MIGIEYVLPATRKSEAVAGVWFLAQVRSSAFVDAVSQSFFGRHCDGSCLAQKSNAWRASYVLLIS